LRTIISSSTSKPPHHPILPVAAKPVVSSRLKQATPERSSTSNTRISNLLAELDVNDERSAVQLNVSSAAASAVNGRRKFLRLALALAARCHTDHHVCS
jgi:hypothetical protein